MIVIILNVILLLILCGLVVQMLTYLMLVRLANLCPNAVLQRKLLTLNGGMNLVNPSLSHYFIDLDLNSLIEPLRATIQQKVKANSVKQEFEKQDELKRSALRATVALLNVPDSSKCLLYDDDVIWSSRSSSTKLETITLL